MTSSPPRQGSPWTTSRVFGLCLAVLVAGFSLGATRHLPGPSDWLRGIEAAAMIATGIVVFWYTSETQQLRKASEQQVIETSRATRLGVRPVLLLDVGGGTLRATNVGLGPALEVEVLPFVIEGSPVALDAGAWTVESKRVPVIPVGEPHQQSIRTTPVRESDGWHLTGVAYLPGESVSRLPAGEFLRVRVRYLDLHLFGYEAEFSFESGAKEARPMNVEELGYRVTVTGVPAPD